MVRVTHNIPQVQVSMKGKQGRIGRATQSAIQKAGFLVERHSKQRAPVDTGRLRSSIRSRAFLFTATIRPNVNYAQFVHDGTRFMRGRPFMKQGLRDSTAQIRAVFSREIKGALR